MNLIHFVKCMFVPKKGGTLEIFIYYWLTSGQYSHFNVSIHAISELKYTKHVTLHYGKVGGGMAKVLQLQQASCVCGVESTTSRRPVCGVESTRSRRSVLLVLQESHVYQELMSAVKRHKGASNCHTLVSSILCRI